jgi:fatty acid desaturase
MSRTVTTTVTKQAAAGASAAVSPAPGPSDGPRNAAGKLLTHILIDGEWYDLTNWKPYHPGGPLILEQMNGQDATDAFYSLHGADAIARLSKMPRSKTLPSHLESRPPPPPTAASMAFRKFRAELQKEGWFERSVFWELFYTLFVYCGIAIGTYFAYTGHPWLAILVLGITMQQSGWIGHDYTHARGEWCHRNGLFLSCLSNGFSRAWWSNKHNTHHVFTNYIGLDADIENDPVFHLFFPKEENDTFFRKMQHWYFIPVASVLYFSWKVQSLQYALERKLWKELVLFAFHYAWLYSLGIWVALGAIYLGGGLVAVIVTATHQSEEMIDQSTHSAPATGVIPYSFCEGQFATTRDAATHNFLLEWLWGGMQYQLEHHLFPTMPKYYYSRLAPRVKAFAGSNGLSYRCDGHWEILQRNFNTLKYFAGTAQEQSKKAQ